jgi:hypothetical protein
LRHGTCRDEWQEQAGVDSERGRGEGDEIGVSWPLPKRTVSSPRDQLMSPRYFSSVVTIALALVIAGCGQHGADPVQETPAALRPSAVEQITDQWLGTWNGPEGTWLRIDGGHGRYEVTIQNLDGPRSFQGSAVGAGIEFERDGVKEVIYATDGVGTGMKWLSEKNNCLAVHPGEGFCRE